MRIYTGRSRLMEAALIDALRGGMNGGSELQVVVVPKQLTLQTERTLLSALVEVMAYRLPTPAGCRFIGVSRTPIEVTVKSWYLLRMAGLLSFWVDGL